LVCYIVVYLYKLNIFHYFKYADDTAILALLNKDNERSIAHFSMWCEDNFLHLNISKTKELGL